MRRIIHNANFWWGIASILVIALLTVEMLPGTEPLAYNSAGVHWYDGDEADPRSAEFHKAQP